jgi:hypothetical protein
VTAASDGRLAAAHSGHDERLLLVDFRLTRRAALGRQASVAIGARRPKAVLHIDQLLAEFDMGLNS